MNNKPTEKTLPFPPQLLLRVCVVLIVVLALVAGFYEVSTENWQLNHQRILKHFNVKNTNELLQLELK
jgi:hypothetical protein